MALKYLTTFVPDFSPAQRRAFEDLVERAREGSTINLDEVNALSERILEGTDPVFRIPVFGQEIIDGCKITTAMEAIRIDLSTAYTQLRDLEALLSARNDIQTSTLDKLHQAVLRLDETLLTHKFRRLNSDYTEIRVEDFVSAQNEARTPNRAIVEPELGQLVASKQEKIEYLIRGGELRPTYNVDVRVQGLNPDRHTSFLPEAAAQKNNKYVWAEILLADSELRGFYEGIQYDGAVVLFDIQLPQMERINEVKLAPFGRFDTNLIKIQYQDGDTWLDIPDSQRTLELDTTAVRFDTVITKSLRLVLQKEEYRFNHYAIERGQVKRSNWLNIALEGSLESAVNDQSTLPARLRADRLDRAQLALSDALQDTDAETVIEKYRRAVSDVLAPNDRTAVRVSKFEYIVGLKSLEVNYVRRSDTSEFTAKPLQATSSVFEITSQTFEEHQQFHDGVGLANITSIQHWIDVGGGREIPILPEGTTTVNSERLNFDANRIARTRFAGSSTPSVVVRRDGVRLTSSDFTIVSNPGERVSITIREQAWRPTAKYNADYSVDNGQDRIRILDMFDSIKGDIEEYQRTDRNNRLSLKAHPFILKEIALDRRRWSRPDPREARWEYRGPNTRTAPTDDPYIIRVDGRNYGRHPEILTVSSVVVGTTTADFSTTGNTDGAFPSQGEIRIGDEYIYYTEYTSTGAGTFSLSGMIRGYRNSAETSHAPSTQVEFQTEASYEPITVKVNGARCLNRTDYITGQNPAFTDRETNPEYIQIGSTLYFDRPISGRIEIKYDRLVDHLTWKSKLFVDHPNKEYTPVLDCVVLKLNTADV